MKVDGKSYRTIWLAADGRTVEIIDQTLLPHEFKTVRLTSLADAAHAIKSMQVRGAPLIGVTAAYGLCLALHGDASNAGIERTCATLLATRPTAVNLRWALEDMRQVLTNLPADRRIAAAYRRAGELADADVETCAAIGDHGLPLIRQAWDRAGRARPVNVLTHCNAGWLATVDWGTALAPIYKAQESGIPLHVWADETRPRNQGASLTAWELGRAGVPHMVIVDNVGGHLMQHGKVDLCIVGTDRTTATGDVCNKIGTYLKALAAHDNGVPFYVALPHSTIDWTLTDGIHQIPIEERDAREVTVMRGRTAAGAMAEVTLTPADSPAGNYAFDVTPARLITGLITERGVCAASAEGLLGLYPERRGGVAQK
ncbi:MAG TPA: S-methyl-5-thioribose-1-phosphate isomerase [Methylomirabilota bacterium]|nr:S-methyl-5-thioribose-1-phosphate isomerase [Methylomirabilota bacterium]